MAPHSSSSKLPSAVPSPNDGEDGRVTDRSDIAVEDLNARAWIEKGQRLETGGDCVGAVSAYDRAVALLGDTENGNPRLQCELAIAWMNRGNALQKQGGDRALEDALEAYAMTIDLLKKAEVAEAGRVSLGCAYMNRAGALQKLSRLTDAAQDCDDAIAVLGALEPGSDFHVVRMLAAAWLNRGSIALGLRTEGGIETALSCSRNALALVGGAETRDFTAADIALKARQIFCEACSLKLDREKKAGAVSSVLGEMSDAAEAALQVVFHWQRDGFGGFEWVGTWFFRFTASLYAEYQPQFLGEFVTEHLRAGGVPANPFQAEEWRNLAAESLARARLRLHSLVFSDPQASEAEQWIETLGGLAALEAELSRSASAPPV